VSDIPVTRGVRVLREKGVVFTPFLYEYEEHGGTRVAAAALGVPERIVVKTLVFETDARKPLLVLMHGDREVSTKQLARVLGVRQVVPCSPEAANRHTGYVVGGISPLGTTRPLPVYAERTVMEESVIWLNGGKRGFLVGLAPGDLKRVLGVEEVDVAREKGQ
jgi:Cys-tRNA(Pro) deacylase